jgi:hypothetical protein
MSNSLVLVNQAWAFCLSKIYLVCFVLPSSTMKTGILSTKQSLISVWKRLLRLADDRSLVEPVKAQHIGLEDVKAYSSGF